MVRKERCSGDENSGQRHTTTGTKREGGGESVEGDTFSVQKCGVGNFHSLK